MFTHTQPAAPGPTPPGLNTALASPASPSSRPSRLRGLSYLRNYTQTHLLSREPPSSTGGTGSTSGAGSHASTTRQQSPALVLHRPSNSLTRSVSYSPTSTPPTGPIIPPPASNAVPSSTSSSSRSGRFSLVPVLSHPLGAAEARLLANNVKTSSATPTANSTPSSASDRLSAESSGLFPSPPTHLDDADAAAASADHTQTADTMTRARSATTSDAVNGGSSNGSSPLDILPSIRFTTFHDLRANRPSLTFSPVSRTLPTGSEVIRVGRYSERDNQQPVPVNVPSAAPVGFKSKVVSRRHCEFWYEGGKWYIKDIKSSSGTFLNHIRLSPPGTESKPFPINDGDIVQLGIDFKGGEEMIFRCVKMRLELNRGWQNKLNTFNLNTHKRLRNMTQGSSDKGGAPSQSSQDCSICLNSIAPCQCLFVAPCSHTWHYKCIRALLTSPSYPIFICPNCRAAADLEAEVEDPEEWEQMDSEEEVEKEEDGSRSAAADTDAERSVVDNDAGPAPRRSRESTRAPAALAPAPALETPPADPDAMDVTMHTDGSTESVASHPAPSHATSEPVPIPASALQRLGAGVRSTTSDTASDTERRGTRTPSPSGGPVLNGHEGPITPRNDAGPWVFDGSDVRIRGATRASAELARVSSIDAAAAAGPMDISNA